MSSEQTVASIILTSGGSTFGILGTLLSSLSSLYIIRNISSAGCNAVEYLPKLLDFNNQQNEENKKRDEEKSVITMSTRGAGFKAGYNAIVNKISNEINSYMWISIFLMAGMGSKKLGTFMSSPSTISWVEQMIYKRS